MWGYVIAGVVGVLWSNTTKPATKITKSLVIGPKTGYHWTVEYLEDLAVMVVIQGATRGAFKRTPEGWRLIKVQGDRTILEAMKKDFE